MTSTTVTSASPETNSRKRSQVAADDDKNKKSKKTKKTPYDIYVERLKGFQKSDPKYLGFILVRGVNHNDDEDEEDYEEVEEDTSKYTTKDMESVRFVMITKNRSKQLDAMRDVVLGDQADEPSLFGRQMLLFNTAFSNHILRVWRMMHKKVKRCRTPKNKLDMLFALTYRLNEFDFWIRDNEGDMGELVKDLGSTWKELLQHSDEELGWDVEYTKPGILAILEEFQAKINDHDECFELGKFQYL